MPGTDPTPTPPTVAGLGGVHRHDTLPLHHTSLAPGLTFQVDVHRVLQSLRYPHDQAGAFVR